MEKSLSVKEKIQSPKKGKKSNLDQGAWKPLKMRRNEHQLPQLLAQGCERKF